MSRLAVVFLPLLGLLAGCPPPSEPTIEVYAVTAAPPARTAAIVTSDEEHTITISRGVALAMACWDSCRGACDSPTFTVGNPEVVSVRPASRPSTTGATWVLVAAAAGETSLTVRSACAEEVYAVNVLAP